MLCVRQQSSLALRVALCLSSFLSIHAEIDRQVRDAKPLIRRGLSPAGASHVLNVDTFRDPRRAKMVATTTPLPRLLMHSDAKLRKSHRWRWRWARPKGGRFEETGNELSDLRNGIADIMPIAAVLTESLLQSVPSAPETPTVWCGAHTASECPACTLEHGESWCNGDCEWTQKTCKFRHDLVWCGSNAEASCSSCSSCQGDCKTHGAKCLSVDEILAIEFNSSSSVQPEAPKRRRPNAPRSYGEGDEQMSFYDNGCCKSHGANVTTMRQQFVADCMLACLGQRNCIAVDVTRPNRDEESIYRELDESADFNCTFLSNSGYDFNTSCDEDWYCYRKIAWNFG